MARIIQRFEIRLTNLNPTIGSEMQKTRPCLVISNTSMILSLDNVIIVPLTSTIKAYPIRVPSTFLWISGEIALDHIRAVDKSRLIKKIGELDEETSQEVCDLLQEMFAY